MLKPGDRTILPAEGDVPAQMAEYLGGLAFCVDVEDRLGDDPDGLVEVGPELLARLEPFPRSEGRG